MIRNLCRWATLGGGLCILFLVGCQSNRGRVLPAPGPVQYQQQQAVLHDPYPSTTLGPEMTGVRPREYQQPQPEATQSKYFREGYWGNWGR